jgi:hypothetical protein
MRKRTPKPNLNKSQIVGHESGKEVNVNVKVLLILLGFLRFPVLESFIISNLTVKSLILSQLNLILEKNT